MCQVTDDSEVLLPKSHPSLRLTKNCVKCQEKAVHAIGTNGTFCSPCFEKYFTHKFRASMGRNPIVRNNDKVLLAYSGGNNSAALLHLIKQGLEPSAPRKLKFKPGLIFIDGSTAFPKEDLNKKVKEIQFLMKESGLPCYTAKLEEVFEADEPQENSMSSSSAAEKLSILLNAASTLTVKQELLYRLRCRLLAFRASQLGYDHVFLAETSTRLAINILSNVALGRGAHLPQDTGFSDGDRFKEFGVNLLRPIRDISAKEVVMYNAIHKVQTVFLPSLETKQPKNSSIQTLTEGFVLGLVAGFPSTEMTVYRTSNKIKSADRTKSINGNLENEKSSPAKCKLCSGFLDNASPSSGATARDDITFSENLYGGLFGSPTPDDKATGDHVTSDVSRKTNFVHRLCYSCSTLQKEVVLPEQTDFIALLPDHSYSREVKIDEKLKDVLLTD